MSTKRYRPEEIIAKLREADVLLSQGSKMGDVVKAIGIHEVTYYRWRKEYGGLKVTQRKRQGRKRCTAEQKAITACLLPGEDSNLQPFG